MSIALNLLNHYLHTNYKSIFNYILILISQLFKFAEILLYENSLQQGRNNYETSGGVQSQGLWKEGGRYVLSTLFKKV